MTVPYCRSLPSGYPALPRCPALASPIQLRGYVARLHQHMLQAAPSWSASAETSSRMETRVSRQLSQSFSMLQES